MHSGASATISAREAGGLGLPAHRVLVVGHSLGGGIASLMAVLLQHRVSWSHFGDTWALPGGARHEGESACAMRFRSGRRR